MYQNTGRDTYKCHHHIFWWVEGNLFVQVTDHACLDEGFAPAATWSRLLLAEQWAEAGVDQEGAAEMAEFLAEEEGGYSRPAGRNNHRMRRLLEEIYKDPTTFYTGDLAARITTDLKVVVCICSLFDWDKSVGSKFRADSSEA